MDHLKALHYMIQAGGRMAPARVSDWSERAKGELIYRGPNTMIGYAENDADLKKDGGSNILPTGDIARRLPNGVFEIVGRKSRFVKLFGLRISLEEVERHLQEKGVSAAYARTVVERSIVSIIYVAGYWQFLEFDVPSVNFFPLTALALIWLPGLPIPRLLQRPLRMIAGASLVIYLRHFQAQVVVNKVLPTDDAAVAWLGAIVGGVVLWRLYSPVDSWIDRQLHGPPEKWHRLGSTRGVTER